MVAIHKISEHELACQQCAAHIMCSLCGEVLCSRIDDCYCARQQRLTRDNKIICVVCADKKEEKYRLWTYFDSGVVSRFKLK